MPELPAGSVDFILTDPPYLVGYQGRWDGDGATIVGDDDSSWVRPAFSEMFRVLRDDAFAVTFYGWPRADLFVSTFREAGFRLVSHLAFVKNVWGLGRFTRGQHEVAYLLAKGKPRPPADSISDVIEWTREPDAVHPNQKPVHALYPLLCAYRGRAASSSIRSWAAGARSGRRRTWACGPSASRSSSGGAATRPTGCRKKSCSR